jgi:hypothetical protein
VIEMHHYTRVRILTFYLTGATIAKNLRNEVSFK